MAVIPNPFGSGSGAPSGPAGGDLGGTYPDPSVVALQGIEVDPTPPTAAQVLTALDDTSAAWADAGGGGAPSGPAGGDLDGTYPNPTVVKTSGAFTVNGNLTADGDVKVSGALTLDPGASINFGDPGTTGSDLYLSGTNQLTTDYDLTVAGEITQGSQTLNDTYVQVAGDIGGTASLPEVTATHLSAPLPVSQGGTGSDTQAYVSIGGDLGGSVSSPAVISTSLTDPLPINQGGTGSNTQVFTNLAGDLGGGDPTTPLVVSTTLDNPLPLTQGGTGSATKNFVDLTTTQTVGGAKTFSATLATTGALTVGTNLSVTGIGHDQVAVKSSGTSRASTTTLSNDPDLTLPVVANATYAVWSCLGYTTTVPNGGGGLQFGWSFPTSATMQWSDGDGTGNSISGISTFQSDDGATIFGVLKTSSTAGNLVIRWAQAVSDSTATILLAGCSLYLRRLA